MFAQAKCKLPISSQKQNIVAHTTHTQKNKNTKTQKKTFPVNITNLFYFCSCNMQYAYALYKLPISRRNRKVSPTYKKDGNLVSLFV